MAESENISSVTKSVNATALSIRSFVQGSTLQKIILLDLILLALLNTLTLNWLSEIFGISINLPPNYKIYLGLLAFILFLIAVIIRIRELTIYKTPPTEFKDSSPIKGPLSFQFSDFEIFKHLQRDNEIQLYKNAVLQSSYRFGILTAQSGSGKSSILNAGLAPAIKSADIDCVIAIFTNKPAIDSIKEALVEQLKINTESLTSSDLGELLSKALVKSNKQKIILVFDQFEQFFTQNPKSEDRKIFIEQVNAVYLNNPAIKILISIRSDFLDYMREIQERLGYSLDATRNYFTLKKFSVQQAVAILIFIADAENIENKDIGFLEKICVDQLATKDDNLISPVDIQIISLVIKNNKDVNTSFNQKTFNSFGGIEGLLKKYIDDQLNTPNLFKKDSALNGLLALIDTNRNVRAGRLTEDEIMEKLGGVSKQELSNILIWLEKIRLIHKIGTEPSYYELAHEILIRPLLLFINESNEKLRKANNLIETRTIEWIRSNRSSRYLFNLRESYLLSTQKKMLTWGSNESVKKQLISKSSKRHRLWGITFLFALTLLIAGFAVKQTEWYKLNYELKSDISNYIINPLANRLKVINFLDTLMLYDKAFALEIINKIKSEKDRESICKYIAIDLAKEYPSLAMEVADMIKVDKNLSSTYLNILKGLVDKKSPQLFSATKRIYDSTDLAIAYIYIADSTQNLNEADSLYRLSYDIANKLYYEGKGYYRYSNLTNAAYRKNPILAISFLDKLPDSAKLECYMDLLETIAGNSAVEELTINTLKLVNALITEKAELANKYATISSYQHDKIIRDSLSRLALNYALTIENKEAKEEILSTIAHAIAVFDPALSYNTMSMISKSDNRDSYSSTIVDSLSGSFPEIAFKFIKLIDDKYTKNIALSTLVDSLSNHNTAQAISLIKEFTDSASRDAAYANIAVKLSGNNIQSSFDLINRIHNPLIKAETYVSVIAKVNDLKYLDTLSKLVISNSQLVRFALEEEGDEADFSRDLISALIPRAPHSALKIIDSIKYKIIRRRYYLYYGRDLISNNLKMPYEIINKFQDYSYQITSFASMADSMQTNKRFDSMFNASISHIIKDSGVLTINEFQDFFFGFFEKKPRELLMLLDSVKDDEIRFQVSSNTFRINQVLKKFNKENIQKNSNLLNFLIQMHPKFTETKIFTARLLQKLKNYKKAYAVISDLNYGDKISLYVDLYKDWILNKSAPTTNSQKGLHQ